MCIVGVSHGKNLPRIGSARFRAEQVEVYMEVFVEAYVEVYAEVYAGVYTEVYVEVAVCVHGVVKRTRKGAPSSSRRCDAKRRKDKVEVYGQVYVAAYVEVHIEVHVGVAVCVHVVAARTFVKSEMRCDALSSDSPSSKFVSVDDAGAAASFTSGPVGGIGTGKSAGRSAGCSSVSGEWTRPSNSFCSGVGLSRIRSSGSGVSAR